MNLIVGATANVYAFDGKTEAIWYPTRDGTLHPYQSRFRNSRVRITKIKPIHNPIDRRYLDWTDRDWNGHD